MPYDDPLLQKGRELLQALYNRSEYALYRQAQAEGEPLWTASRRAIVELWQRAQEGRRATGTLLAAGFPDVAAARVYYAAFDAASALL